MATLTIRLPDDKQARLRQLAKHRQMSMNKLIEELSTGVFMSILVLRDPPYVQRRLLRIDVVGIVLLVVGLTALQLFLERSEREWVMPLSPVKSSTARRYLAHAWLIMSRPMTQTQLWRSMVLRGA
jgi:hypothetical protein